MVQEKNLITLWEEMGASTGALLGRLLGLNAYLGLQALELLVVAPLAALTPKGKEGPPPPGDQKEGTPAQGNAGIRTEVWQQMGLQYGVKVGEGVGQAMDLLVHSFHNGVVEPLNQLADTLTPQRKNPGDP